MKTITVLGGGTGMSQLLKGFKEFPFNINAIVAVSDDGRSTGRLRKEFNIPAIGDIRQVVIALSEKENIARKLLNYRFNTSSDLDGHPIGNLLLTALADIDGSIAGGIADLDDVLNLKGKVIPLTEDNVVLMGEMEDGRIVRGEHCIAEDSRRIKNVFYEKNPTVSKEALNAIKKSDAIVLSIGSLYTSIIPNLVCPEIKEAIDNSKAKIIYVCNMMTQPGETDYLSASEHLEVLNNYLGKRKIEAILVNNESIAKEIITKYKELQQKIPVEVDYDRLEKSGVEIIEDDLAVIEDGFLRHNSIKVALNVFSYLIDK